MALSKQILIAFGIEGALIFVTLILLLQPTAAFGGLSNRMKSAIRSGGLISLCLVFCWSVILGCVLSLHQLLLKF